MAERAHCPSRRERGSSLMLMPAGLAVFLVLGALAVDLSAVRLSQRELVVATQAAASDAAAAAYDEAAFYSAGEVRIDRPAALAEARASLAARGLPVRILSLHVDGDGAVVLEVEMPVTTIFARAVPGAPDSVTVEARATAALAP